ncbi:MAG TPA: cbb3-type cytochrome c oxidase subunit I [Terriglobales bacterium]|nr:cbb3-type cytochrome c oxidase subunit I [Terriglobales bacterium]
MSTASATVHHEHGHHEDLGFVRTYLFSLDHKMIAKQFLAQGLFFIVIGALLAFMVRWEIAYNTGDTDNVVPFTGWIPEPFMYEGHMNPAFYNALFTMHATIMIFFAAMPILVGCFGNYLIPLMIGTRDMAFPLLNMLSFWVSFAAGIIMLAGFFVEGGHAAGGWTSYAPLSSDPILSGVGWGQHLWGISILVLGVSSLMGSVNYITTIVNMRAPGMTWFRLPLTIWALFIVAILLLLALPVLSAAIGMLLLDRMAGTSFFNAANGGEPLLWQHLFWFFGHPEVYILILPPMGIASDVLSTFARKPIFGYRAMAFSMMSIAFLSWIVWGHHMFQSGMNPTLGTTFMITTMVIAVPSAIKTFNWLGTLWGGNIRFTTPMLFAIGFVGMFVIGGLSGIYMASTPVDIFIHDTYFIVAHIHYVVFGGSVLGIFAGIYYWYPKMFGRMMNETLGKLHFWGTIIFMNATFFPMHILGVGGHMRRIANPMKYEFLQPLQPINEFITISALLLGLAQIPGIINFFYSMFWGEKASDNPWEANTLEWVAPTPPPHGNFLEQPTVYRGPYEYSSPEVAEDFLPQNRRLGPGLARAAH